MKSSSSPKEYLDGSLEMWTYENRSFDDTTDSSPPSSSSSSWHHLSHPRVLELCACSISDNIVSRQSMLSGLLVHE